MSQFKPAIDYLPHEHPMVLVDIVHDVGPDHAICEVSVQKEGILAPFFNEKNGIPAWYGIEMMAQTIGVWRGWHGMQQSNQPKIGMLLGTRAFKSSVSQFEIDDNLIIKVNLLLQDDKLGSFDCCIEKNNQVLVQAKLNVYQPDDLEIAKLIHHGDPT